MQHGYILTIRDLFAMRDGVICGGEMSVAIMDGEEEIDRVRFAGKVGPGGDGYQRRYIGRPGLKARVISGPGTACLGLGH